MNNEEKILEILGTLQGQMGTLQGQMGTLQGQVETLQGQMGTLQGQVQKMDKRQDAMAQDLHETKMIVEKKLPHEIHLIAEGHTGLARRMDDLCDRMERVENKLDEAVVIKVAGKA